MRPELQVTPERGGVWSEVSVRLSGWDPHALVTVRASLDVDPEHRLASWATFVTDEHGGVDAALQAPVNGSYHVADAAGLLWSLTPESAWEFPGLSPLQVPRPFRQDDLESYQVLFTAVGDRRRAEASIARQVLAEGVRRVDVDDPALAATLFLPAGPGPHPALIQFGGSGGGIQERRAAQYAAHGWATLALGYFRVPGRPVPATLDEVPLEYFLGALAWLRRQPDLITSTVALSGTSRGGELALLLGSLFPDFAPILAWVPSSVVWGTHAQPGGNPRGEGPTWTLDGQPVAFVPPTSRPSDFVLRDGVSTHSQAFLRNLAAVTDRSAFEIAVERIAGPVLLLGGQDDALWPSGWFVDQIRRRLHDRGFAHPVEAHVFPEAGHAMTFENEPTTFLALGPDTSAADRDALTPEVTDTFHMGGTPRGNAAAARQLRTLVWDFLDRHAPRSHSSGPAALST